MPLPGYIFAYEIYLPFCIWIHERKNMKNAVLFLFSNDLTRRNSALTSTWDVPSLLITLTTVTPALADFTEGFENTMYLFWDYHLMKSHSVTTHCLSYVISYPMPLVLDRFQQNSVLIKLGVTWRPGMKSYRHTMKRYKVSTWRQLNQSNYLKLAGCKILRIIIYSGLYYLFQKCRKHVR